jgi:hypothetical protein
MAVHMIDQKDRHDVRPDGHQAKLARARAYLEAHRCDAIAINSEFRYRRAEHGSRVLRPIRRKAA